MASGVKPGGRQHHLPGSHISGQVRIERLPERFQRVVPLQVKCNDLPASMHAGIRPACDLNMPSLPAQASQSLFYF